MSDDEMVEKVASALRGVHWGSPTYEDWDNLGCDTAVRALHSQSEGGSDGLLWPCTTVALLPEATS